MPVVENKNSETADEEEVGGSQIDETDTPTKAEKVTVACKLANGVYLDLRDSSGQIMQRYKANGANHPDAVAGFGLTKIPKDHWDAWVEANKSLDIVRNGVVFAQKRGKEAKAQARDTAGLTSGQEPLDPNKVVRGVKKADVEA